MVAGAGADVQDAPAGDAAEDFSTGSGSASFQRRPDVGMLPDVAPDMQGSGGPDGSEQPEDTRVDTLEDTREGTPETNRRILGPTLVTSPLSPPLPTATHLAMLIENHIRATRSIWYRSHNWQVCKGTWNHLAHQGSR